MQFSRPIILASKSPRRAQLLREAGFDFTVQAFDTDETFPADMPPEDVAPMLAQRKARAAAHILTEKNEVILSADSVVILDGEIFNKPADYDEAFAMIRRLAGRKHRVVTGCCLLDARREAVFAGVSDVFFDEMTDAEIDFYIRRCQPFDKAGAYGVQEWIGHCKIQRIEGTYTNVMGLPVNLVYEQLRRFE